MKAAAVTSQTYGKLLLHVGYVDHRCPVRPGARGRTPIRRPSRRGAARGS